MHLSYQWRTSKAVSEPAMASSSAAARAGVYVAVFLQLCVGVTQAGCPTACECMWKDGKQTVECQRSSLRDVPESLDGTTQVLNLSGNQLKSLSAHVFRRAGLVNLQKIYLRNCSLVDIDEQAFVGLTNLIVLDLSGNLLTRVPGRSLQETAALRELRLDNNPIQRLADDDLAGVVGLVNLDLADCKIGEVEAAAFNPLGILERLRISGNRLKELPERAVVALARLYNIELHANPWECDCRLRSMQQWLSKKDVPYPIVPTCHGPPRVAGRTFDSLALDQFSCPPQLMPMVRQVITTAGENATLSCRIVAMPQPRISWFRRGQKLENNSILDYERGAIVIIEEGHFERVSNLVIPDVRDEDADYDFVCVGVNTAGDVETNFTVTVGRRMALLTPLDSGQIAGIIVGLLLLLLVVIAVIFIVMSHRRREDEQDKGKPFSNGVHNVVVSVETAPDDEINPVQKPPRLTDFGFVPHGRPDPGEVIMNSNGQPSVYVRGPDLIKELDAAGYPTMVPANGGGPVYGTLPYYPASYTNGNGVPSGGMFNPLADDSYELHQLPSESSDLERLDPSIYGYPADYGLPIPEMSAAAASSSPYGVLPPQPAPRSSVPPPEPAPSYPDHLHHHHHPQHFQHSQQQLHDFRPMSISSSAETAALNSSRDSRAADLSASHDSAAAGDTMARRRSRQMGVPVLPPLPVPLQQTRNGTGTDV